MPKKKKETRGRKPILKNPALLSVQVPQKELDRWKALAAKRTSGNLSRLIRVVMGEVK